MTFKPTNEFTNSIRAAHLLAETSTTHQQYRLSVDAIRAKYGDEAGNAYDDLLAARVAMSRVYNRIRDGEI